MKKNLFSFGLLLGAAALSFQSCDSIKDKVKTNITPFNFTQPEVTFEVPIVASTQNYAPGPQTYVININQIIKDNAKGFEIDIDDITKIAFNKVTLQLLDGTEQSNWTNFEYAVVVFNTDKGKAAGKPDLFSLGGIEDISTEKYKDQVAEFNDINLKEYFNGGNTTINYTIDTKARRSTNKILKIKATIEYTFIP